MKVRILYPSAVSAHLDRELVAGAVVQMDDALAMALIREGAVESAEKPEKPKPAPVEQATAEPGAKRPTPQRRATRKRKT